MPLRALCCRLSPSGDRTLAVSAWAGTPEAMADGHAAIAYLVPQDTLGSLRVLDALLNDRGKKHPARSLSAVLLGQPRVPLVQAEFKSSRQLARSVRALLVRATARRERKPYVIGIPRGVFDSAAARAGSGAAGESPGREAERDLILLEPEDVPPALEATLVGDSQEMRVVRQWIVRAARYEEPVLVLGDTGTGKEVVARAIHHLDPVRHLHPFLPVNCGAIPRELFESEVFGYVAGAFTHARRHGSDGLWRAARGGTIFLDEIGDLAPEHQVKILRVLEERKIRPVGSAREVDVDARVIAATNRDLYSMLESGEFRDDLYYRLASLIITLPRLRDRPEDVAVLAAHFWKEIAPRRAPLDAAVLAELRQYRWQGNARELRYILMNLHTTFPKEPPSVERLRAVLRMRAPRETSATGLDADDALRRVENLRHLRRARAAIEACRRMVRAFNRKSPDPDARGRTQAEAAGCLTELQLLVARPERFQNLATFEIAHRLSGAVSAFHALLAKSEADARRYARKDLAAGAAAAAAAVRRDEERTVRSL